MPDYIKPMGFVLLRAIAAMLFFWILNIGIKKSEIIPFTKKDWARIAACALFGVCLNQLCFFKGLNLTAPISSSVIMTTVPILVLVLSFLILKNPMTPIKMLGVFIGLIGSLIIIFSDYKGGVPTAENPTLGNLLILINATSYSLYLILAKPLLAKFKPIRILKWLFTFGFLMILPFGFQELREVQWASFPNSIVSDVLFVLIAVSCLTYLFNLSALRKVNPSTVSVFIYSQPIFAIAYSLYLGNDTFNILKLSGAILIFIGVYFVISTNFKKKKI